MPRALMKVDKQRFVREVMGRIDVSGSAASVGAGKGFTVTYTAAGKYKVTLSKPGRKIIFASAIPIESTDATAHSAKVKDYSGGSYVNFNVYVADATDGALVDNVGFYFRIVVEDHA